VAIFVVLVSALSSLAVALSVITWFLPNMVPDSRLALRNGASGGSRVVEDPILNRKIKQSMFAIYDTREKVNSNFYKESAYLGEAMILSSDGWAVVGDLGDKLLSKRYWEVVDAQGTAYKIKKFVFDTVSGLTYFKVDGEGFRVTAFYQWNGGEEDQIFWSVAHDNWQEIFLAKPALKAEAEDIFTLWQPRYVYGMALKNNPGVIILSAQGELAGFVSADGNLTPDWLIENQLSNLLSQGEIVYSGLSYQGYLVEAIESSEGVKALSGFYVTYSPDKLASSTVGVGDVIVKINNKPIDKTDLSRQVLLAPAEFFITVLRGETEDDIMVKKVKVMDVT